MTEPIKITSLTPIGDDLHDDDQFVIIDVSDTTGDNSSVTGSTKRISFSKLAEKLGTKGEPGEPGRDGNTLSAFYDETTGVLTLTTVD